MKVARYYSSNDIRLEEVIVPKIRTGEILVQVKACGLCGSDIMEWYVDKKAPIVLGHEPTGIVTKVAEDVKDFQVSDRVFVHHHVPCFVCHNCLRGHYTLCKTFKTTHIDPGGFSEYIRVPALNVERDVLKIPSDLTFEQATLIEPVACCLRGIRKVGMQIGDTVSVVGVGVTGLIHVQLAKLFGAGMVIATDFSAFRLEKAHMFGADFTFDAHEDTSTKIREVNKGRGTDIVIITAGNIKAIEQGLDLAGEGATVLLFAPTPPEVLLSINPYRFFFSEISIVASYSCSPLETRQALKLIQRRYIEVDKLITHHFDLARVGKAIRLATEAKESLKIIITP